MLDGLSGRLRVWQVHGWAEATRCRAPHTVSHVRPMTPALWASTGINKKPLDGGGGMERGGPSWFPHAGMAAAWGTQGVSLLALPPALSAPNPGSTRLPVGRSDIHSRRRWGCWARESGPPGLQVSWPFVRLMCMPCLGILEACTPSFNPFPLPDTSFAYQHFFFSLCAALCWAHYSQFCGPLFLFIHSATSLTASSLPGQGLGRCPGWLVKWFARAVFSQVKISVEP